MIADELTCHELVELVTEYLEGALPPEERARLDQHLTACLTCGAYLDQLRQTIRVTGRLRVEAVSPDAETALRDVFRAWKQERSADRPGVSPETPADPPGDPSGGLPGGPAPRDAGAD